jgi:Domain of unknown function (DUF4160)
MPEISRFLGIVIRMFFAGKEHNPPHFHAYYGNKSAVFSIETLEVLRGSLPPRVKGLVVEWAELHKNKLMKNWDLLQTGKHEKIKPLV